MSMNAPETMGVIYRLQLSQLHPHPQNPFSIRDDQAMLDLIQSVQSHGVPVPAIARPRPDGEYEIIAGHRRKHASELAGLDFMPVVVLDLNDDEAIIQLVDSNIQRENILPSERAKAYKMRMEAMKRQGARTDLTSPNISAKFRSDDELGQEVGVSGDTIRNYASLTNLVPELMQMVDEGRITVLRYPFWVSVCWSDSMLHLAIRQPEFAIRSFGLSFPYPDYINSTTPLGTSFLTLLYNSAYMIFIGLRTRTINLLTKRNIGWIVAAGIHIGSYIIYANLSWLYPAKLSLLCCAIPAYHYDPMLDMPSLYCALLFSVCIAFITCICRYFANSIEPFESTI